MKFRFNSPLKMKIDAERERDEGYVVDGERGNDGEAFRVFSSMLWTVTV